MCYHCKCATDTTFLKYNLSKDFYMNCRLIYSHRAEVHLFNLRIMVAMVHNFLRLIYSHRAEVHLFNLRIMVAMVHNFLDLFTVIVLRFIYST